MNGKTFSEYKVREVTISAPDGYSIPRDEDRYVIPDKNGAVIAVKADDPSSVTDPICTPIEEKGTLTIGGIPVGTEVHKDGFTYTVNYVQGEQTTQNENVRTDVVTNSRPGVELFKTDWSDAKLSGAVFTLKDSTESDVAQATYTSRDQDGLITIAYLEKGSYTLTEIETPFGYIALDSPVTITIDDEKNVAVSGIESKFFSLEQATDTKMASIRIKNRPVDLKITKIDAKTQKKIPDVHFALYRQVIDSTTNRPMKDYSPIAGYSDLITDEQGLLCATKEGKLIPLGLDDLVRGNTYYLTETRAAEGYEKLESDICFSVGKDGKVTVNSEGHSGWLSFSEDATTGKKTWSLTIPNGKMKKVSFLKVDTADQRVLSGAEFDLYQVVNDRRAEQAYISGLISNAEGLLEKDDGTVFSLPVGTYHLIETKAPAGYNMKTSPVIITITDQEDEKSIDFSNGNTIKGITYDEGTTLSSSGSGKNMIPAPKSIQLNSPIRLVMSFLLLVASELVRLWFMVCCLLFLQEV